MISLTTKSLTDLLTVHPPPCLSVYQSTHRQRPENQRDALRFGRLVRELEASLKERYPDAETSRLLQPFEELAHDAEFWSHTLDGLAVLGAPGFFRALRIARPFAELAVVAASFHTKPLRRFVQSLDRYQLLELSVGEVRLFEGSRHALDELELVSQVPRTIAHALGEKLSELGRGVASPGRENRAGDPARSGYGGQGEADVNTARFFHAVDRAVSERYSVPSGLPLVLAGGWHLRHLFHQVSQNPHLVAEGAGFNPDGLSPTDLHELAWEAVEPRYHARLTSLREEFQEARARGQGSDDLSQVAAAASSGRIHTLLIDAERRIAGRLHHATGRIELADLSAPETDDVLDDLSQLVAGRGGTVLALPPASMPSRTGLAATYRY